MSSGFRDIARIAVAAAVVAGLALIAPPWEDDGDEDAVARRHAGGLATCAHPVFEGPGAPELRQEGITAGRIAVGPRPLSRMVRERNGSLTTKMPIQVVGHRPVRIWVQGNRAPVRLYYGRDDSFGEGPGTRATRFEPCTDRPRTVFPGGLRVYGPAPVVLRVVTPGDADPEYLRLGRPRELAPQS